MDVPTTIRSYRAAATALRRLTGSNGSTTRARTRHEATKAAAVAALTTAGHRQLVGKLVDEQTLVLRLAADPDRPELRRRLTGIRADLTNATHQTAALGQQTTSGNAQQR